MREEVHCAECKRETPAGALCTLCEAPLTGPPIASESATPKKDIPARVVVGLVLTAFSAWLLTLNVVAGSHPVSSPDYETPGDVAGNAAIFGTVIAVGVALMISGIRRRRRR